jgi:CDP-glycerol glycerophosphotransferase
MPLNNIKRKLGFYLRLALYYLFRVFPIRQNKIFVTNFNGKGFGDHPKYIVLELLSRQNNCQIVWQVKKEYSRGFPPSITTVPYGSLAAIYGAVTSKIWIDNCRKQLYVRKRKKQFYIQTWHSGPLEIKKIERDVENILSPSYVKQARHDSTMIDLFLAYGGSDERGKFIKSVFWYEGEIFKCGCPRDDIFFTQNSKISGKVLNHFHLDSGTKLILFAPTFRDIFTVSTYSINFDSILDVLSKKDGGKWVFLVRLHPNISEKAALLDLFNDSVINATGYDDMQELLYASDILITDYSDCMFEFALLRRPLFLYFEDIISYKKERDFYLDIFSLPFPVAQSMDELINNIETINNDLYSQKIDAALQESDSLNDGKASRMVADRIMEEIKR